MKNDYFEIIERRRDEALLRSLDEGAYYREAVAWAIRSGLARDVVETASELDDVIDEAEMATLIWRAAGRPSLVGDEEVDENVREVERRLSHNFAGAYWARALAWTCSQAPAWNPFRELDALYEYYEPADFDPDPDDVDACLWPEIGGAYYGLVVDQLAKIPGVSAKPRHYADEVLGALGKGALPESRACSKADAICLIFAAVSERDAANRATERRERPATAKQVAGLKKWGFDASSWTLRQASAVYDALRANGWRVPANLNPASYVPA